MTLLLDQPLPLVPDIRDDVSQRQFIVGGTAAGLLVVAGCGSDDDEDTAGRAG